MRALVIVLVLVAASFIAVLTFGLGRDRPETGAPGPSRCGDPPPIDSDDPDPDALEDWKPPCTLDKLKGTAGAHTASVRIERPKVVLAGENASDIRQVPSADKGGLFGSFPGKKDDPRTVRLELVEGNSAVIVARQPGEDEQTLCLCRGPVVADDVKACSAGWILRHQSPCPSDDAKGSLTFGAQGGSLTFLSARGATVVAK